MEIELTPADGELLGRKRSVSSAVTTAAEGFCVMNPTCSFDVSARGKGLDFTTFWSSPGVRSTTVVSTWKRFEIAVSRLFGVTDFAAEKMTLPLCIKVLTSEWPSDSKRSRSSAIGTLLFPPTLTARSNATYLGTSSAVLVLHLGAQGADRALLLRTVRERVEPVDAHRVLVRDLGDLVVGDAVELLGERLG